MARNEDKPGAAASGDKKSPDKSRRTVKKPTETEAVKVVSGRVVKTKPPTVPKKPPAKPKKAIPAAAAEPAQKPTSATGAAAGDTTVRNTVNLSKAGHEALQAGNLHGLDARQAHFIDLWLVTQNATQAYQDAGYECKSDAVAAAAASRLLKKVKEHPYTHAKRAELFARTEEITGRVIERVYGAAMADPRELVEYVYKCCRFCHGTKHQYQMTPKQMKDRKEAHKQAVYEAVQEKRPKPKFDPLGGLGFDATLDPHPECPECNGEGIGKLVIKDTRHLSPGALSLYGGTKQGKDGIEVKVADQRPYLEMLGRLFNINIEPVVPPAPGATKEDLDALYERAQQTTRNWQADMAKRAADLAAMDQEEDA